ncbi:hypothetical protein POL68_37000 [Stigmatella sp. ncwal1]|uniref:Lipoprotein n=1 Tax=Stigmatella ashevillensis TaxID=2995309 RepID=A0ABT5DN12_9BACT|nr:hypothetical protein [Stigmatella ashevillena]MDC0714123.1 hypothetical protein [Stigmatella ashevillena]
MLRADAVRLLLLVPLTLWGLACQTDPGPEEGPSEQEFRVVELDDVTLTPGQTLNVKILVLSTKGDKDPPPVELSVEGLPQFATLEADTLRLAPGAEDLGESQVRVIATARKLRASEEFLIRVIRSNKAPELWEPFLADEDGFWLATTPQPVVRGFPFIKSSLRDEDGDATRLFAEVVPEGTAFSGVPTHQTDWVRASYWNTNFQLTGLPAGQRLRVYVWGVDERGAVSNRRDIPGLLYSPRPPRPSREDWRTCGTQPVDVSSNAQHCGECEHSCLGSTCAQGLCAPSQLTGPLLERPTGLAVDAGFVYWSGLSNTMDEAPPWGLYRIPKAGGHAELMARRESSAVIIDGDYAYLASGSVARVPLRGGAVEHLFDVGSPLRLQGERLYWVRNQWFRGQLESSAKVPGSTPETLGTYVGLVLAMHTDAQGVYLGTDRGEVLQYRFESNSLEGVASGLTQVNGLATDEQFVYVAYGPSECSSCPSLCFAYRSLRCFVTSKLVRIPRAGGTPEELAQVSGAANTLTVEGEFLYWSHDGRVGDLPLTEGSVMRMPKAGGAPRVLVDGFSGMRSLAFDAHSVYGYAPEQGVFRAPK